MKRLIDNLKKTAHGFKHIIEAGNKIISNKSCNHFDMAVKLLHDESYQARMLATYILGQLSTDDPGALTILETTIALDENWRVQEMLAKAFDHYCKTTGYKNSLPTIHRWLASKNAQVKRAVIEGLRSWTSRPYFKDNPTAAIELISRQKADDNKYLRRSIGNALRDISKRHPKLVAGEIAKWDLLDPKIAYTYRFVTIK